MQLSIFTLLPNAHPLLLPRAPLAIICSPANRQTNDRRDDNKSCVYRGALSFGIPVNFRSINRASINRTRAIRRESSDSSIYPFAERRIAHLLPSLLRRSKLEKARDLGNSDSYEIPSEFPLPRLASLELCELLSSLLFLLNCGNSAGMNK